MKQKSRAQASEAFPTYLFASIHSLELKIPWRELNCPLRQFCDSVRCVREIWCDSRGCELVPGKRMDVAFSQTVWALNLEHVGE